GARRSEARTDNDRQQRAREPQLREDRRGVRRSPRIEPYPPRKQRQRQGKEQERGQEGDRAGHLSSLYTCPSARPEPVEGPCAIPARISASRSTARTTVGPPQNSSAGSNRS